MNLTIELTEQELRMIMSAVDERQDKFCKLNNSEKATEYDFLYNKLLSAMLKNH